MLMVAWLMPPVGQTRTDHREKPLSTWVGTAMTVALILGAFSVTIRQVRSPLWSNDVIAIWAMKAKLFAAAGGIDAASLGDPGFDFSHPEYPLLWPVTMAAPMVGGTFDGHAATLFAPFLTLLLLACLAGELRRRGLGWPETAAFGLILLSFEGLLGPFHVGLAELPLAVALLVTAVALSRLREDGHAAAALLVAVGLCAAVLIKNEGMALLAASAVVLLWPGRRPGLHASALALGAPAVVLALALMARRVAGFAVHGDAELRWLGPGVLAARLGQVTAFLFQEIVRPHFLVALVLVALLVLGRSAGGRTGALGALVVLLALAYLPAYLWTRRDLTWHLETTLARIAAPLGVLLLLLAGSQLAAWLRPSPPR
jgi:hypothetical protein